VEISIPTDEIDPDVSQAIESAAGWGITLFEIRKVSGQRVPRIPASEFHRLREALARHRAAVTALSPGLFKRAASLLEAGDGDAGSSWWEDDSLYREYRSVAFRILQSTLDLAERLTASSVIIFTPEVPGDRAEKECPARIVELISEAAALADKRRMALWLENDIGLWADTGKNAMRILARVGQSNLKVNWDPANAFVAGERPFPEGYERVKGAVGNVHAKDATRRTPAVSEQYEVLGNGEIDWPGQIRALSQDGYTGAIGIETHSHPLREKTRQNVLYLRGLLDQLRGEAISKAD
jgi:sugar phosphate isomerase/epimerase